MRGPQLEGACCATDRCSSLVRPPATASPGARVRPPGTRIATGPTRRTARECGRAFRNHFSKPDSSLLLEPPALGGSWTTSSISICLAASSRKPVTPEPRQVIRRYGSPSSAGMLNAVGLANPGVQTVAEHEAALARRSDSARADHRERRRCNDRRLCPRNRTPSQPSTRSRHSRSTRPVRNISAGGLEFGSDPG